MTFDATAGVPREASRSGPCACDGPVHFHTAHIRALAGTRVAKAGLSLGAPCIHRVTRPPGCGYCHPDALPGAGCADSPLTQFLRTLPRLQRRYQTELAMAYFQAETSTGAPWKTIAPAIEEVAAHPAVWGCTVSTRPDCAPDEALEGLARLAARYGKPVWIEFGLQSAHDRTLRRLNRGHDAACFADAVRRAHEAGLAVGAHAILGLPGEGIDDMLATVDFLGALPLSTVKFHHLQIYADTPLAEDWRRGEVPLFEGLDAYLAALVPVLRRLPWRITVQRVFTDGAPRLLLAPRLGVRKNEARQRLLDCMAKLDALQGDQAVSPE